MDKQKEAFIDEFRANVTALVYSEGEGGSGAEDKFTEYCLEKLEEIEETEGPQKYLYIYPNSQGGIDWKINAWCLKDESKMDKKQTVFETVDIFISLFDPAAYDVNIGKDDLTKLVNQFKRFLNAALKGHIDYIDASHRELNQFVKLLSKQAAETDRINLYVLTNGNCSHTAGEIVIKGLEDITIKVNMWDLNRFYKLYQTNSKHEPIEIKFSDLFNGQYPGIECLVAPAIDPDYQCYLALMPGKVLAKLYDEYTSRLLESNVRAFLQQNGKINKGIRDTIKDRDKHPMFLPYNNGLSATAESVVVKDIDGKKCMTKINDFQIVNGGQTTASLFHTEKKFKSDLTNIYVQMKLTVIRDVEKKHAEVPNISRYANSQNKISELDLSSNNPFFVKLEELSRKKYVINSSNRNQQILWYFERASGQYKEALNKLTPSQQKAFKERNPAENKFVKSDVAKFINLWDQEPFNVAQGSQKNFVSYTKKINEAVKKGDLPGENFYKKLIASAILFNTVDKLFGRKNQDAIGDTNFKSFACAYTVSYFHYLTDNTLDTWKIYNEQKLDVRLADLLKDLIVFVFSQLQKLSGESMLSEQAKKEATWKALKTVNYKIDMKGMADLFVSKDVSNSREVESNDEKEEDEIAIISKIYLLGIRFWDGLVIFARDNPLFNDFELDLWDVLRCFREEKNLSGNAFRAAKRVLAQIESNTIDPVAIADGSQLKDSTPFDYRAIYDRMSALTKRDWDSIYGLGEKTKMFDGNETANLKTVANSVLARERAKENSLKKAHESLLKLKKLYPKY